MEPLYSGHSDFYGESFDGSRSGGSRVTRYCLGLVNKGVHLFIVHCNRFNIGCAHSIFSFFFVTHGMITGS